MYSNYPRRIAKCLALFLLAGCIDLSAQGGGAKIESIALSTTSIELPPRPGMRAVEGRCNNNPVIEVRVIIPEPSSETVEVETTVSGGRITSTKGLDVKWDLGGVGPGTYSITAYAKIKDEMVGEPKTAYVTVAECRAYVDGHTCPSLAIAGPNEVNAGETFKLNTAFDGGGDSSFNWSISSGVIVGGQGTREITIKTDPKQDGKITATLSINNFGGPPFCETTSSLTVQLLGPVLIDEFKLGNQGELKARLDAYLIALSNHPESKGVIEIYPVRQIEFSRILNTVNQYIKLRGFDMSRISIVNAGLSGRDKANIKLWRIPAYEPLS